MGTTYGTIVREEALYLPGGKKLPLSVQIKEYVYYESETVTLTLPEALRLAGAEMKNVFASKVGDGELLSKELSVTEEEDGLLLHLRIRYTKNIAAPIFITDVPK